MRRALSQRSGLAIEVTGGLIAVGLVWLYTATSSSPYITPLPTVLNVFRQTWLFADFSVDLLPSLERLAAGYTLLALAAALVDEAQLDARGVLGEHRVVRAARPAPIERRAERVLATGPRGAGQGSRTLSRPAPRADQRRAPG